MPRKVLRFSTAIRIRSCATRQMNSRAMRPWTRSSGQFIFASSRLRRCTETTSARVRSRMLEPPRPSSREIAPTRVGFQKRFFSRWDLAQQAGQHRSVAMLVFVRQTHGYPVCPHPYRVPVCAKSPAFALHHRGHSTLPLSRPKSRSHRFAGGAGHSPALRNVDRKVFWKRDHVIISGRCLYRYRCADGHSFV